VKIFDRIQHDGAVAVPGLCGIRFGVPARAAAARCQRAATACLSVEWACQQPPIEQVSGLQSRQPRGRRRPLHRGGNQMRGFHAGGPSCSACLGGPSAGSSAAGCSGCRMRSVPLVLRAGWCAGWCFRCRLAFRWRAGVPVLAGAAGRCWRRLARLWCGWRGARVRQPIRDDLTADRRCVRSMAGPGRTFNAVYTPKPLSRTAAYQPVLTRESAGMYARSQASTLFLSLSAPLPHESPAHRL